MEKMTSADKEESERNILVLSWQNALKRAVDFDAWGQPVEALDLYQRLSKQLHKYSISKDTTLFPCSQMKVLEKIALCLDSRRKSLTVWDSGQEESISIKELKLLVTKFENLFCTSTDASSDDGQTFPIDVAAATAQFNDYPQDISHFKGCLLPKPLPVSGKTHITIGIDYIGVKDSSHFLDPYLSISVKSTSGQAVSCVQNTPTASNKVDSAIIFDINVHIEKALESLPEGFAIFFEFKHYKPKKNAFSTYCWTFLEQDELIEGPRALELYKKPIDYQRKSLKLLTVKPLFLHLNLSLYS